MKERMTIISEKLKAVYNIIIADEWMVLVRKKQKIQSGCHVRWNTLIEVEKWVENLKWDYEDGE